MENGGGSAGHDVDTELLATFPDPETTAVVESGWVCRSRIMSARKNATPKPVAFREDRIRAHVHLCWLALLLLRVVENATVDTWRNVSNELDRMHLVTLATADGRVAQRSATTAGQKSILAALELPEPPRFFDFTVPQLVDKGPCRRDLRPLERGTTTREGTSDEQPTQAAREPRNAG